MLDSAARARHDVGKIIAQVLVALDCENDVRSLLRHRVTYR
jgi:hypothetical protein